MAMKSSVVLLVPLALLLLAGKYLAAAQLEVGYYSKTCPNVEAIVREEMEKIISAAPSLAGPLLRLHFHDCFVRVSGSSVSFSFMAPQSYHVYVHSHYGVVFPTCRSSVMQY
jgi:peroxidase